MILASKSPRRQQILEESGFVLEIIPANVEEKSDKIIVEDKIMDIANLKVVEIAKKFTQKYILGADTVVLLGKEIIEKPKDEKDASKILRKLSGRCHEVITGYSFINFDRNIKLTGYEKTKVYFRELTDHMIDWYISTKEPMDKAGAYGIQGKGAFLVERIEGDFFNVMGFPISNFIKNIEKINIKIDKLSEI